MRIHSTQAEVYRAEEALLNEFRQAGMSDNLLFAAQIVLDEALINAYQHGNKCDASKQIQIEKAIYDDYVELAIADEGEGFDPDALADPTSPERLMASNGRGIFLIREFASVVRHNKRGNRISVVLRTGDDCPTKPLLYWAFQQTLIVELFDHGAQLPDAQFQQALLALTQVRHDKYVIDLKRLTLLSRPVIEGLASFHEQCRPQGREIVLARPAPEVAGVLKDTSLFERVPICRDIAEALSLLTAAR